MALPNTEGDLIAFSSDKTGRFSSLNTALKSPVKPLW